MSTLVPVIDLTPFRDGSDRAGVVAAVRDACERIGFLVIGGHGVDGEVIAAADAASRRFFALPFEEKVRYAPAVPWFFRGYERPGGSSLGRTIGLDAPPDLVELFRVSRFDDPDAAASAGHRPGLEYFFCPNIWPDEPAELRPALMAYYRALEALAATMMRIFALALDLPESWFDDKVDHHITNLCVNYYPPQDTPPAPGQLRRGPHTDYGSMTILHQDGAPGGLQVVGPGGEWEDVPHRPGTFVVNIGDLMSMWTNDRWRSTMHRVVNLPRERADADRVSIPFFHQPNFDAVIECIPTCVAPGEAPRHPPVTSGEWVRGKTRVQVGVDS